MTIFLLVILLFILIYLVFRQQVGAFSCFAVLYFSIAVALFKSISPVLFSLNAIFHVGLFAILLIWQIHYYSFKSVLKFLTNPVILSIIALSIIIYCYNDFSPYYHTYKEKIDAAQFGFYSKVIFPLLLLPLMIPDSYTRNSMVNSIPYWGVFYILALLVSFELSMLVMSDRSVLEESTGGITGSISLSRIFAVSMIVSIIMLSGIDKSHSVYIYFYIGLSIVFFLLVLIAGQRGTLIGAILAIISLALRNEYRKHFIITSLLIMIVGLISIIFVDFGKFEIFQRFSQFENLQSFERYYDYIRTWNIFKNNDFLWGLGSLGYHFKTGRPYPHNIILEHVTDYGLPGLICICVLLCFCIKYVIQIIKLSENLNSIAIACCWIVLCFSAMVSSSLLNHQMFYTFTGLLVLAYLDFKQEQNKLIIDNNINDDIIQ